MCCAFSAQFAINFGIKKRQSWYKKNVSTPSVLRFLSVIHHESPHYNHVFSKKAQHLWRWISLRILTRGRLVPRQPRAIKRTTRTELRRCDIRNGKYIYCNNGAIPTALHQKGIHIAKFIHWNTGIKPTATCVTASYICKQMLCYGDSAFSKLSFTPYRLIKWIEANGQVISLILRDDMMQFARQFNANHISKGYQQTNNAVLII